MTFDDEWPLLDRMAAKQLEDPMLRFGGEDAVAALDPGISTQVLGSDPIAAADMGLRNVDRVAGMLIPATTQTGRDYQRLAEMYQALLVKRDNELGAETRYQGGRGTAPFAPVPAERQRQAVKFLVDRAFTTPKALLDPEVLMRITPTGGMDPLQGSNVKLLSKLLRPGVFNRLSEARMLAAGKGAYAGIDLLKDLNDGLFSELDRPQPTIEFYRRALQRNYVTLLMASSGAIDDPGEVNSNLDDSAVKDGGSISRRKPSRDLAYLSSPLADTARQYTTARGRPSEFRSALHAGVNHLAIKMDQAMKKIKDPETLAHVRDLRNELEKIP
jgi:hypothetical protein